MCLPNNSIHTSIYSIYNFIPKQLFFQFSKLTNFYFVLIGTMQMVPALSISDAVPTIYLPLSCIVVLSSLKDLYEDYKRKISDDEENNLRIHVVMDGVFREMLWSDVRVGHVIRID
jgi:phospholipid-transporting ATPase